MTAYEELVEFYVPQNERHWSPEHDGGERVQYYAPPEPQRRAPDTDIWSENFSLLSAGEIANAYSAFYDPPGDCLAHFMETTDALAMYIMGPFGSAKSKMIHAKIVQYLSTFPCTYQDQTLRWSRGAWLRSTLGDIERSVLQDLNQMFGPLVKIRRSQSRFWATYSFRLPDGTQVESEMDFFAADALTADDRFKSFEAAYGASDETSMCAPSAVDTYIGRLGRLPTPLIDCPKYQPSFFGAYNPPNEQHPLHIKRERSTYKTVDPYYTEIKHYNFENGGTLVAHQATEAALTDETQPDGRARYSPTQLFYAQPPAAIRDRHTGQWRVNEKAENFRNTGKSYYVGHIAKNTEAWIAVNLGQEPGSVLAGKRVHPEYNPYLHRWDMPVRSGVAESRRFMMGVDFGRSPAAIIGQPYMGGIEIFDEFGEQDSNALLFGEKLIDWLWDTYRLEPKHFGTIGCDPSGDNKKENSDDTAFINFRAAGFYNASLATVPGFSQNSPLHRHAAMTEALTTNRADQRAFLTIHTNATMLRQGLYSDYTFRQIQQNINGVKQMIDSDELVKGPSSHFVEAAEYMLVKAGCGRKLVSRILANRKHESNRPVRRTEVVQYFTL